MNKTCVLLSLAILVLLCVPVGAEEVDIQAQNHLEASHNPSTDKSNEKEIIEDWLDVDIYSGDFLLGFRYSSYSPPDPSVSLDGLASEGITHRFAEFSVGDSNLRLGTFTCLIGRGLVFRSFENRDLRLDSGLDGFLFKHYGSWWEGTFFSGRAQAGQMEAPELVRTDRFSGIDLGANFGLLSVGSSFLSMQKGNSSARPEVHGLRAGLFDGPFQIDWEGARFIRQDGQEEPGLGNIVEASLELGPIGLYGGYKHYERAAVMASETKLMNQPPVLIHDQRVTLLNRQPHVLDPEKEKGLLADLSLVSPIGNFLLSYAETQTLEETLGESSYAESFLEWDNQNLPGLDSAHLIIDFKKTPYNDDRDIGNIHWIWEYYATIGMDIHATLPWGGLVLLWEHQHKRAAHVGEFDDEFFTIEYEHPGGLVVSLLGEYVNWNEEQLQIESDISDPEYRQFWGGVQLAKTIADNHDLRLYVGSRREGQICIGGVCRYEPEFEGVELTLISRY